MENEKKYLLSKATLVILFCAIFSLFGQDIHSLYKNLYIQGWLALDVGQSYYGLTDRNINNLVRLLDLESSGNYIRLGSTPVLSLWSGNRSQMKIAENGTITFPQTRLINFQTCTNANVSISTGDILDGNLSSIVLSAGATSLSLRGGNPRENAIVFRGNVEMYNGVDRVRISAPHGLQLSPFTTTAIECDEIRIKNWKITTPDYVFDKNYRLQPLDTVEKHIRKEKHLPEIPSHKEIKRNGLDLAEMNMLLLKKVEELTLYTIAQEKRLKKQEERLLELESILLQ